MQQIYFCNEAVENEHLLQATLQVRISFDDEEEMVEGLPKFGCIYFEVEPKPDVAEVQITDIHRNRSPDDKIYKSLNVSFLRIIIIDIH